MRALCRMIAAQSPLAQTVEHFLQMVQENGVSVIVTLTRGEEQDADGTLSDIAIINRFHIISY